MNQNKKIIAIIPARGGSKGLARKNIRILAGKPLIAHTIFAAKNSKLIDRIFISTEDEEIARISEKYGAETIKRPKKLAGDYTPSVLVLKDALDQLEKQQNYKPGIVVYLQPTDIFRKKGLIDKVIRKLLKNPDLDSVFVAYPAHKNYWQKSRGQYRRIIKLAQVVRQKKEPIFREDTGIASAVWANLIKKGERIGDKVEIIGNRDGLSSIDIHDEFDLWTAEVIIKKLKKTNKFKKYELS